MSTPERRQTYRRSYGILAGIAVVVAVVALAWCTRLADQAQAQNRQTRQELCGVIGPFASTPASAPTSPKQKTTATTYEWHQRFMTLSREFDC